MYTYSFETAVAAIWSLNDVLGMLACLAIPALAALAGFVCYALNVEEAFPTGPLLLLPGLAALEGILYLLACFDIATASLTALRSVLLVAEVVGAVVVFVIAVTRDCGHPIVLVVSMFLLGFAPFGVLLVAGMLVGALFGIGLLVVVVCMLVMFNLA